MPGRGLKSHKQKKKTPFIRNKLLSVQASAFPSFPAFCSPAHPFPGPQTSVFTVMVELASQKGRQYGAEVKDAAMEPVGTSASSPESPTLLTCLLNLRAPPVKGG